MDRFPFKLLMESQPTDSLTWITSSHHGNTVMNGKTEYKNRWFLAHSDRKGTLVSFRVLTMQFPTEMEIAMLFKFGHATETQS